MNPSSKLIRKPLRYLLVYGAIVTCMVFSSCGCHRVPADEDRVHHLSGQLPAGATMERTVK